MATQPLKKKEPKRFDIKDFTHAGNAKFIFVMVNKGVPY